MNSFVNAVQNQTVRTTNGMRARRETASRCVDLFFKAGASRGKDITKDFIGAYAENREHALRIAQWLRDARGGAGERELFRQILKYLEKSNSDDAILLAHKVPELGRYDDLFTFETPMLKNVGFSIVQQALNDNNGLAGKWTPRKGVIAAEFRKYLGWTPKFYRKRLVELTNVVETNMCSNTWDTINFSHVPSVASARYKKAFNRHTTKYAEYVASLVKGDDPKVKVNASAVYPYDVLKGVQNFHHNSRYDETEKNLIIKQWEALPNFIGDANILPLVDVSGSMTCPAGGYGSKSNTTCLDVAVSLGLYCADKNTGAFKDLFLTFSTTPELLHLQGNVVQKAEQMVKSNWAMSTNLHAAFDLVLNTAVANKVPQSEMPEMLLIFSDMQFDRCIKFDESALEMIERKYLTHGYNVPKIVFWNINSNDNVPVKYDTAGVALVSGFSPSIVKAILAANMDDFTPQGVMMATIMNSRYDI